MKEFIETLKVAALRKYWEDEIIKINESILESDPTDMTITRMLIEREMIRKFVKTLEKL